MRAGLQNGYSVSNERRIHGERILYAFSVSLYEFPRYVCVADVERADSLGMRESVLQTPP